MPVYIYRCEDCKIDFEVDYAIDDDRGNLICPDCSGRDIVRVFSEKAKEKSKKSCDSSHNPFGGG